MKNELKPTMRELNPGNRKIIRKMMIYLESHNINERAYEKIICDIIGMAIECQKRGELFSDAIGMDYEAFCRELIENAPKQTVLERILQIFKILLIGTGILIPVLYIIAYFFPISPATCNQINLIASPFFLLKYFLVTASCILMWLCTERGVYKSKKLLALISAEILWIMYIFGDLLEKKFSSINPMRINLLIWTGAFILSVLLCEAILRKVEKHQAKY